MLMPIVAPPPRLHEIVLAGTPSALTGMAPAGLCPLTATKGVVFGSDTSGLDAQTFTVDANYAITLGTKYAVTGAGDYSSYTAKPRGIALTATSGLLVYVNITTGQPSIVAFTEAAGVLTFGTPVNVGSTNGGVGLARLGDTSAVVVASNGANAYAYALTVSGTAITLGTGVDTGVDDACDVCALSATRAIVVGGGDKGARAFGISGTTVTLEGSELTFTTDTPYFSPRIRQIDATRAFVAWENNITGNVKGRILQDDGSGNLSLIGTETTLLSSLTAPYGVDMARLSASRFLVSTLSNVAGEEKVSKVIKVNGSIIDATTPKTHTVDATHGASFSFCSALSPRAGIINYSDGGTLYLSALKIA